MRQITVKYAGECRTCNTEIAAGETAWHERKVGIFCDGCQPTDADTLRAYRQESIDARAETLAQRADKRRAEATRLVNVDAERMSDIAFVTQPGHFPERARAIKRREKAANLAGEADALDRKAAQRTARVKGDAEARHEQRREAVRQWLKPGMQAHTGHFGVQEVCKVNKKTARIRFGDGHEVAHDLMFFRPAPEEALS